MDRFFEKAIADVKSLSDKDFVAMADRIGFKTEIKADAHSRPETRKPK